MANRRAGLAVSYQRRPDKPAFPELFRPITIGKVANRIVMAPTNVLMSPGNLGYVSDQQLAYYAPTGSEAWHEASTSEHPKLWGAWMAPVREASP
ncbi:MAG: hypothetical protein ABSB99_08465 [Acidimicrobiales bacterium]|jgi:hypothetical protein